MLRTFTNSPQTLSESKFAKIQISHFRGEGGRGLVETNFQLLMLSLNLLKSKFPIFRGGGGGGGGVGGGLVETNFQVLILSPNLLKSKNSHVWCGGGGAFMETNFQLLMLSSNLLKSKVPIFGGGGGEGLVETNFQLLIAEFKFAKIQNSHVWWKGGGVSWRPISNF